MGHRVLIVDDSATMRSVIKRVLQMSEVPLEAVWEAADGAQALTVMREHPLDLVLADVNMPGMNGLEMTRQMQAEEALRDLPVVIISTEASATRIEELKSYGARGYVHKPFTPEQIRTTIEDVLGACHAGDH